MYIYNCVLLLLSCPIAVLCLPCSSCVCAVDGVI